MYVREREKQKKPAGTKSNQNSMFLVSIDIRLIKILKKYLAVATMLNSFVKAKINTLLYRVVFNWESIVIKQLLLFWFWLYDCLRLTE